MSTWKVDKLVSLGIPRTSALIYLQVHDWDVHKAGHAYFDRTSENNHGSNYEVGAEAERTTSETTERDKTNTNNGAESIVQLVLDSHQKLKTDSDGKDFENRLSGDSIGKNVSIISNKLIRYTGTIENIDPEHRAIKIKDVKIMGSEGRIVGLQIPSQDSIFPFVVFGFNDIAELIFHELSSSSSYSETGTETETETEEEEAHNQLEASPLNDEKKEQTEELEKAEERIRKLENHRKYNQQMIKEKEARILSIYEEHFQELKKREMEIRKMKAENRKLKEKIVEMKDNIEFVLNEAEDFRNEESLKNTKERIEQKFQKLKEPYDRAMGRIRLKELDFEKNICRICFEVLADTVLCDCGHLVCEKCASKLEQCPFDRKYIMKRIKVFRN